MQPSGKHVGVDPGSTAPVEQSQVALCDPDTQEAMPEEQPVLGKSPHEVCFPREGDCLSPSRMPSGKDTSDEAADSV